MNNKVAYTARFPYQRSSINRKKVRDYLWGETFTRCASWCPYCSQEFDCKVERMYPRNGYWHKGHWSPAWYDRWIPHLVDFIKADSDLNRIR